MEGSTLKLIVEKGPREGNTIDCKPGSVIRIGRLVKGNNFTIKDAGISSNHLAIELKDGKWVVSDLDTSNGTLLNGESLQPMRDYGLSDDDVIKIGERTSLRVEIEEPKPSKAAVDVEGAPEIVAEEGEENRLRRNPRRGAPSRRARASKNEASDPALLSVPHVQIIGGKSNTGTENRGRTENVVSSVAENPKQRGRPTRARVPKDETVGFVETREGTSQNVGPVEEKKTRGRGRRKVGVSKDQPVAVKEISQGLNMGGQSCREVASVSFVKENPRGEEALKKNEPSISMSGVPNVPEGLNSDLENCGEETQNRDQVLKSMGSLQKETIKETSPPKNAASKIDLETMTLGEWFDYLEVYLPKQINETTEEIVSSIRERSKQFNEFIQQQDIKGEFRMT